MYWITWVSVKASTIHNWVMLGSPHIASYADLWQFFVVNPNKQLNKQSNCRWFKTPWCSPGVTVLLLTVTPIFNNSPSQVNCVETCQIWIWWSPRVQLLKSITGRRWSPSRASGFPHRGLLVLRRRMTMARYQRQQLIDEYMLCILCCTAVFVYRYFLCHQLSSDYWMILSDPIAT